MRAAAIKDVGEQVSVRPGRAEDLPALLALEQTVFATDRLSRRSLRHFLASPSAELLIAETGAQIAGYALILFRPGSAVARLYSLAISPHAGRRGIGKTLLAAAEQAALRRDCLALRLEVHEHNGPAVGLYRGAGYQEFGRHAEYYGDGGSALRFEKRLAPGLSEAMPPYFHQTTEFTCGPACMRMALAWADPSRRLDDASELKLWREATTIFMTGGPGGCGPFGVAVTLKRHGLNPEIYVSRPGPYFIDTVRDVDKQRVMRLVQSEFRREADELRIPTHVAPLAELQLIEAFEDGAVAIVMVAGYHMIRRTVPHWVFAFAHQDRRILVHDPAARRDQDGNALAPETYAVPLSRFQSMSRCGPDHFQAAVLIRKGDFA